MYMYMYNIYMYIYNSNSVLTTSKEHYSEFHTVKQSSCIQFLSFLE